MDTITLAFIDNLFRGPSLLIILILGLLIFGRKLPEVGRGLGRGIVEFRKGLKGIEDEIETESSKPSPKLSNRESSEVRTPVNDSGEDVRVSRNSGGQTPA